MAASIYRLTDQAFNDLDQIADYLRERSPSAAIRVMDQIHRTFKILAANPEIGARRDDLHTGLRMFTPARPAGKYVVFFAIIPEGVLITNVIHTSRDWIGMFSRRER